MKFSRRILDAFVSVRELWPLTLLIVLAATFYIMKPAFLSPLNISNMLAYMPELGIIALGMTFLLTAGEFDLSVGSVFGFCPVLMFTLYNKAGLPIEIGVFVVLIIAASIGLAIGLLVTKVKISSFLSTIGMMLVVRGCALYVSHGFPQSTWKTESPVKTALVGAIKIGDFFKLYASLLWFILLVCIMYFILNHTKFGNWITATGGNVQAARARGIDTDRVKIILFMLTSVLAGLAGIISSLRISSAYPIAGTGYELEVIAMTVIGGTLLLGGRGTILGTVIGVLLLRSMRNGIIVVGVPGLAYNIFIGLIILFMMTIHSLMERRATGGGE
ncbi:MAG: ABC transporter permease [bacterium]|nr:ABC transporter permease [bacterium]